MRQGTTLHIGLKRVKDLKQPVCGTYNQPIPAPPTRRIACRFSHPKIDMRRKQPPKKSGSRKLREREMVTFKKLLSGVRTPWPLSHSRGLVQMTSSDPTTGRSRCSRNQPKTPTTRMAISGWSVCSPRHLNGNSICALAQRLRGLTPGTVPSTGCRAQRLPSATRRRVLCSGFLCSVHGLRDACPFV